MPSPASMTRTYRRRERVVIGSTFLLNPSAGLMRTSEKDLYGCLFSLCVLSIVFRTMQNIMRKITHLSRISRHMPALRIENRHVGTAYAQALLVYLSFSWHGVTSLHIWLDAKLSYKENV